MNKAIIIAGLVLTIATATAAEVMKPTGAIRLKHTAARSESGILVKDVAEVQIADETIRQAVEKVEIVATQGNGSEMTVGYFEVRRALAGAEISPVGIDFYGSTCCRIVPVAEEAQSQAADEAKVVEVEKPLVTEAAVETVEKSLLAKVSQMAGLSENQFAVTWRNQQSELLGKPAGEYEIKPRSVIGPGKVCFEVREKPAASNEKESQAGAKVIRIYGQVELISESLTATRAIRVGEVIGESDVAITVRRVGSSREAGTNDKASVIGQQAAVNIAEQQVIMPAMLRKHIVIKRNDAVEVLCRVGQVQVTMSGVAREEGGIGDMITVRNEQNKALFEARVVESGKVMMVSPDESAAPVAAVQKNESAKIN